MFESGIDFVIPWVDGSDPEWIKQFSSWSLKSEGDKRRIRYRDWDSLHFLFRAIEKYTPWVRKVHLVTWGHLPKWLNTSHPKLRIVYHRDFLNPQNIPTFNINAIEVNIHKTPGLSPRFVYFNDDTFLLRYVKIERFFKNGLPRDILALNAISPSHPIAHISVNNVQVIDKHFNKKKVMLRNFTKWFCIKYKVELVKTILLLPWPKITGFFDPHQPQPFLKSTFEEVWAKEREILEKTSSSRFRNNGDVSQYLFRYWQLVSGEFYPVGFSDSYSTSIKSIKDAYLVADIIEKKRYRMLCINDRFECGNEQEFQKAKKIINMAFQKVLPEKSEFEL
ncbi:MAG: hypothetical protein DRG76_11630 [Deltaproteobacteria bacterium]|nr:MAG: hypothetical protein DRG76_11630 [Deltaproteobacteria bacterium]